MSAPSCPLCRTRALTPHCGETGKCAWQRCCCGLILDPATGRGFRRIPGPDEVFEHFRFGAAA